MPAWVISNSHAYLAQAFQSNIEIELLAFCYAVFVLIFLSAVSVHVGRKQPKPTWR
jgi:hypothetical protein